MQFKMSDFILNVNFTALLCPKIRNVHGQTLKYMDEPRRQGHRQQVLIQGLPHLKRGT